MSAALKAMAECLKPGGKILITVPAHQWMWSAHDVVNHHHRRYSKAGLTSGDPRARGSSRASWAGSTRCSSRWPPRRGWPARLTGKDDSDDSPPPTIVNTLFEAIFRARSAILVGRACRCTPGVSIIDRWRSPKR